MSKLNLLTPAVSKFWLYLLASIIWSGVGIYLNFLAVGWLIPIIIDQAALFVLSGLILSLAIYVIMFRPFANQNIERIRGLPGDRICLFAFQRWTSYLLVLVMISLGIFLRVYSPLPKPYLAVLYMGIGTSLFLASLRYYRYLIATYPQYKPTIQE
jgi:hypothetical protein